MHRVTLETYTAMEIQMEAVPFLIDGWINHAIPSSPGVYVLLHVGAREHPAPYLRTASVSAQAW